MSFAWSYSSISDFLNCPRKYQLTRVTRQAKQEETEEIKWGITVHKSLELRITEAKPLIPELVHMEPFMQVLERWPGDKLAEESTGRLCINDKFEPVDWFAKDAWCRGVVDIGVRSPDKKVVWQGDYKTGKRRPGSTQLMLSAALRMHTEPEVEVVRTSYIWLKGTKGKMDDDTHTRAQLPEIWQEFLPKVKKLEIAYQEDRWPPKPSGLCPWCPANKTQCIHSKKG